MTTNITTGPGWDARRGGELPYETQMGLLVMSLRGVNFGFWSHLACSGQSANILSRQGNTELREEKQKSNFFLTCFVYPITSVIINQRFLQIVENIII